MIGKFIRFIFFLFAPELKEGLAYDKAKLEKWKEYAENLVISTNIQLENVIVHNYGPWGLAGRRSFYNYTTHESGGTEFKIPIPIKGEPYIIVPEIIGSWEFHAWIHEIGHYVHKHYESSKPMYVKEYEAEKYSLDTIKKSGIVNAWDFLDIKFSAIGYLDSHIDKAIVKGEINRMEDIPNEIVDFLYQAESMKEVLPDKFVEHAKEGIQKYKKWDRYYR